MKKEGKSKYREGIFIVVYRKINSKIEYLVLKRKLHWKGWEFPKGGLKTWEKNNKEKAVLRELREEAGNCKIVNIKRFNVSGKYDYGKKMHERPWIGQTYKLFAVEVKCNKVQIDRKEHSGHKWLVFKQANKILTWPNQKKCLKIVNKRLKYQ